MDKPIFKNAVLEILHQFILIFLNMERFTKLKNLIYIFSHAQ